MTLGIAQAAQADCGLQAGDCLYGDPPAIPPDDTHHQQWGSLTIYKIVGGSKFGAHSWQELIDLNGGGSAPGYVGVPAQGLNRVGAGPPRDGPACAA